MQFLSNYNQYVQDGGDVVVYNNKYSNCVRFDECTVEDVKNYLSSADSTELRELGFINESAFELEEEKINFNHMKYSRETLNIMLIMTYKCNCNCKYCFEDISHDFTDDSTDDIIKATNYIINKYNKYDYKQLDLHFFGGEPTIKYKEMIIVSNMLRDSGINARFNVITNGVLIDQNMITQLKSANIYDYQITIDGPKLIHDQRRPLKMGKSSWDKIMKSLECLSKSDSAVTIRINIDKDNSSYLEEICKAIPKSVMTNRHTNIYVAPIVGVLKSDFKTTMLERTSVLKKVWAEISEKKLPVSITPPVYSPCPVDSLDSAFYLDLKGNVYSCGGFVGQKEYIERNYDDKFMQFYDRVNKEMDEKCIKCSFSPVCNGGCTFETETFGENCQLNYLKEIHDEYYTKYAE